MRVNILTDRNFVSFYFFYPLLVNYYLIREMGAHVRFFERDCDSLWNAEVVLVDSKVLGKKKPFEAVLERIDHHRARGCKVVWLDSSASSGTTYFQVLPYVSAYWKKQLLSDRSHYKSEMAGGRLFTDYYNKQTGAEVENSYNFVPLESEYESKVSISWNLGVGGYGMHTALGNLLRKLPWSVKPFFPYRYVGRRARVGRLRSVKIAFRGSDRYTNTAIAYQRIRLIELLKKRQVQTTPLGFTSYWHELQSTKIAVSPFGFGEICYRDFEIFLSGAALLKPDMSHIETHPDFFRESQTYIPIKWDFSDLDLQLEKYLGSDSLRKDLANLGQENYLNFRSRDGQEAFCLRFVEKLRTI